jgi:hypothetical protein
VGVEGRIGSQCLGRGKVVGCDDEVEVENWGGGVVIEIEESSKLTGIFTGRSGEEEAASGILTESSYPSIEEDKADGVKG